MENRNNNRHKTDQSITSSVFASHSSNDLFDGEMKNYCDFGMFDILPTQVREGTVLFVRTTSNALERLPAKIEEGFRSVSLVEVKWSKPLSANGNGCYGIGLKHLII